jgi:nitroreductase
MIDSAGIGQMDIQLAIQSRRSVKQYHPQHRSSKSQIGQGLSLALLPPTAFNIQHGYFRGAKLRQQIRQIAHDQAHCGVAMLSVQTLMLTAKSLLTVALHSITLPDLKRRFTA